MLDLVRGYYTTSMALYPDEKRTWQELHHALLLQHMDNMSIREIARREGCHMNAALKSVNGALKKLRGLLQDH